MLTRIAVERAELIQGTHVACERLRNLGWVRSLLPGGFAKLFDTVDLLNHGAGHMMNFHKSYKGFDIHVSIDESPSQWDVRVAVHDIATRRSFQSGNGAFRVSKEKSEIAVGEDVCADVCRAIDALRGLY